MGRHRARLVWDGNGCGGSPGEIAKVCIATGMIQAPGHFFNKILCRRDRIGSEKIRFPSLGKIKQNLGLAVRQFDDFIHGS